MNGCRNVVQLLERRQVGGWSCGVNDLLLSSLPTSRISLSQIIDRERRLLHGHVILGFTRSGEHMISYQLTIDASSYSYSLHWWHFNLHRPLSLVQVCSYKLFRGEHIQLDLHLVVCQSRDEQHAIVVGCRSLHNLDYQPCYVTILPSPLTSFCPRIPPPLAHPFTLHFKFDLLPPFPAFIPSLCLKIPGCVIVNTGDSLVALRYGEGCDLEGTAGEVWEGGSQHSFQSRHTFAAAPQPSPTASLHSCVPSHLLPVEAYSGDSPLTDISGSEDTLPSDCGVMVTQSSLDVELWLNGALLKGMEEKGFAFHSLTDYDLQLVEVCSSRWEVVFIVVMLVEASGHASTLQSCYSVEITASWNILTGCARVLRFANMQRSTLVPSLYGGNVASWNPAAQLSLNTRRRWHLPTNTHHTIRAFSNRTVFTGKSLHSLSHPYLPLTVEMRLDSAT